MNNLKKKTPLIVLETLEKFLNKESDTIKLIEPKNFILKFIDRDENSEFYFNIEQYKVEPGKYQLLVDYKPRSKEIIDGHKTWIDYKSLENVFNNWIAIIQKYDSIKTIFDDPIEQKYQEEFYAQFEIIDEDADNVSFNLEQQLFLNEYLERAILAIEKFNTKGEDEELNILKEKAVELKESLTGLTKRQIMKKLSFIWAKARKYGIPLLKEIFNQVKRELISQLLKGAIGQ